MSYLDAYKMLTMCLIQYIEDKDLLLFFACPLNATENIEDQNIYIYI